MHCNGGKRLKLNEQSRREKNQPVKNGWQLALSTRVVINMSLTTPVFQKQKQKQKTFKPAENGEQLALSTQVSKKKKKYITYLLRMVDIWHFPLELQLLWTGISVQSSQSPHCSFAIYLFAFQTRFVNNQMRFINKMRFVEMRFVEIRRDL